MKTDVSIYTPTETLIFVEVKQAIIEGGVLTVNLGDKDACVQGNTIKTTLPYLVRVRK